MNKQKKTVLIILALLLLAGAVCIMVSAFLGAHLQEIAAAIFQRVAAVIGIDRLGSFPQL